MEHEPPTKAQALAMSAAAPTQSLAQALQVLQSVGLQTPLPPQLAVHFGLAQVKQEMSTPEDEFALERRLDTPTQPPRRSPSRLKPNCQWRLRMPVACPPTLIMTNRKSTHEVAYSPAKKFSTLEPTYVFEFLDRFYLGGLGANVSEKEELAMIQEFLVGWIFGVNCQRPQRRPPTVQTLKSTGPELKILWVLTRVRVAKGATIRPGEEAWDEWPDEDDLLAANLREFEDLHLPSKENVKKEYVSSVTELNLDHFPEELREHLKEALRTHESM
eukprot:IDg7117t1